MIAGAVEAKRRQRIDLAVDLGDPLFQHVEQIERGDFTRIEFADDRARRLSHQPLIRHLVSPVRCVSLLTDSVVL